MNIPDEVSKLKAGSARVIDGAKGEAMTALVCFEAHRTLAISGLVIAFLLGVSFGILWN